MTNTEARLDLLLEKVTKNEESLDQVFKSLKEIQTTVEALKPIEQLAHNIDTIASFGKLVRTLVIWAAGLVSGIALLWGVVTTLFTGN